jgi:hypothetical protein
MLDLRVGSIAQYNLLVSLIIMHSLELLPGKTTIPWYSTEGHLCDRGRTRTICRRSTTDVVDISWRCRLSWGVRVGGAWAHGVVIYIYHVYTVIITRAT